MAEIKFISKKQTLTYPCERSNLIKDIFEAYSKRIKEELDNLSFYYGGKKIIYDEQTLIEDKFDIENISNCCSNKKTIKIRVSKNPFYITFFYKDEQPVPLSVKEKDKMQKIFKEYAKEAKKDYSHIYFLYKGNYYSYYSIGNKTVNEFANDIDKKANGMSITVTDSEEESKEVLNEELNKESEENSKDIKGVRITTINIENAPKVYYNIVFNYEAGSTTIKAEGKEKMKDIVLRYTTSIINLGDPNKVYFLYDGGVFFYEKKVIKKHRILVIKQ